MRRIVLALALAALLAAPAVLLVPSGDARSHEVVVARIDGVVSRGTSLYIEGAVEEAERRGVPLVIELDTPGGLVDATLDIDRALAASQVPVLTYVGPGAGAFAASAGTFILMMGHPSGMAEGTTIGSAQAVQVGPDGQSQEAPDKIQNFLVERMRSIADRNDRNASLAERYITENLNQNADEALATGMVDVKADTLREFLVAVDGMVPRTGDPRPLQTADAAVVRHDPGLLARTIDVLSNPTLAFILMMAGLYSLIFGLANPGTFVPETIGAVLLLLGLIGLGLFGVTTAGFLLIILAFVFFVAEVFTPTHGLFSVAGVVVLVLAAIFLIDAPLLPVGIVRTFMAVAVTTALVSGAVVFAVVTIALRSRRRAVDDRSVGKEALVLERLDPEGRVEVWGEVWHARTRARPLAEGERVRVVGRNGMWLDVEPLDEEK